MICFSCLSLAFLFMFSKKCSCKGFRICIAREQNKRISPPLFISSQSSIVRIHYQLEVLGSRRFQGLISAEISFGVI